MSVVFHCYEFLLIRKLQKDPELWNELKERVLKGDPLFSSAGISPELWFLAITIEETKDRFYEFIRSEIRAEETNVVCIPGETLLSRYLNTYAFVELHLDSVFKYGDLASFPRELFKCTSVRYLSLKYNHLETIPPDIGCLEQLEHLALTNNRLQNRSIPFTLTFCKRLKILLLDNNLLDALPGFLLEMPSLQTVHRHGNHNYFKATFMWYHTDVNDRILYVGGSPSHQRRERLGSLQFLAAKAVIASKTNFYASKQIPQLVKNYISEVYPKFNICGHCNMAKSQSEPGFKVYTFKNPYLGNTCVPFQHWVCSYNCAEAIEIPARFEQMAAAMKQDMEYDRYIRESQVKCGCHPARVSPDASFGCVLL